MGSITGGMASYSRTVKTGDFENKKAEVQLTFTCDEDEYETVLGLATRQAKLKCEEMLGLSNGSTVGGGKSRGPAPEAVDAAMDAKAAGKDAKAQKAAADKAKPKKPKPEPDPEPEEDESEDWDSTEEAEEVEAEEITDAAIVAALNDTADGNAGIAAKCKALIGEFSTSGAKGIPQDKRAAFLKKLAKLKKA